MCHKGDDSSIVVEFSGGRINIPKEDALCCLDANFSSAVTLRVVGGREPLLDLPSFQEVKVLNRFEGRSSVRSDGLGYAERGEIV